MNENNGVFDLPIEKEKVNHPSYYKDEKAPCECIEVMHYIVEGLPPQVAIGIGNLQKYIWRLGKKTPDEAKGQTVEDKILEDMKKAKWYLEDAINEMTLFVKR